MKIAIFDTETTGLPSAIGTKLQLQPRIIELFVCIVDENMQLIDEYESLFSIPDQLEPFITKLTGIDDAMLACAPSFAIEYPKISKLLTGVDVLVAHNLPFDMTMLALDLERIDALRRFPWPRFNVCTVESTMQLKGRRLNMGEMHLYLTGKELKNSHRAKSDVYGLVRCFTELVKSGIIDLSKYNK